jgi:hypothetical protein
VDRRWRGAAGIVDTLLGPEGTARCRAPREILPRCPAGVLVLLSWMRFQAHSSAHHSLIWFPGFPWWPGWWGWVRVQVVGCWLLFENYTVDASIFVAKLLRAHGGCLGIRSR